MKRFVDRRSPLLQGGELNSFMTYLSFNIELRPNTKTVHWIGLELCLRFLDHVSY
jgi:hypothetical protein